MLPTYAFRHLRLLLSFGCLAVTACVARADITLTLEQKDGDKVSDVARIVARAESPDGVDKVEFRLDEKLRATVSSVPYRFDWDTLADTEGAHVVAVTAYDSAGKTRKTQISLTVDNELSLGADVLAERGRTALSAKDLDAATRYARRAMKAQEGSVAGTRILAAVQAARFDWDRAVAILEKAKLPDDDPAPLLELASYRVHRALAPENTGNFVVEIQEINSLRRRAADIAVKETVKKNTPAAGEAARPEQLIAVGDALIQAGRYHEAVGMYGKGALVDGAPLPLVNRMALAYVLDNSPQEAITLLRPVLRAKQADAASRAVQGLALLRLNRYDQAVEAVRPDLIERHPAALSVAAAAATVLKKHREASGYASDAVAVAPNAGETHYALSIASRVPLDSQAALYEAVARSPFQNGPLVDYAARLALQQRPDRFDRALDITDFVRKIEPDNVPARLMQAIIYTQQGKYADAEQILTPMYKRDKTSADLLMTLAVYWRARDNGGLTSFYLQSAEKQDPHRFELTFTPRPLELLKLLYRDLHYRADLFLTPSTLYPAKAVARAEGN